MADEKPTITDSLLPSSGNTSFWRKHRATTAALSVAAPVGLAGFIMLIFTLSSRDRAHAAKDFLKSHSMAGDNGGSNATVLSVLGALALVICFIFVYEILKKTLKPTPPDSAPLTNKDPVPLIITVDEDKKISEIVITQIPS